MRVNRAIGVFFLLIYGAEVCYNGGMKEYVLNYYHKFKCTAQECKHTCCAGWDMCIDESTLLNYKNDCSEFAPALKKGVDFKRARFKADKSGRCAFLNENGLCEIIINLGEQSLCQICRDHPRFRSVFYDRVEMGLGFCCEEATKIILSFEGKIEPILVSDDGANKTPSFIQEQILKLRQSALDIIQNREVDINQRLTALLKLARANVSERDYKKIIKRFISLERLEKSWGARLKVLKKSSLKAFTNDEFALCCEQFLVNSFYRFFCEADDVIFGRTVVLACIFAWWIINSVCHNEMALNGEFEGICDIVRQYSAEVEYSQENVIKLFDFANRFIEI